MPNIPAGERHRAPRRPSPHTAGGMAGKGWRGNASRESGRNVAVEVGGLQLWTAFEEGADLARSASGVSICTFVLVKQVLLYH
jgi:hypothetical protein